MLKKGCLVQLAFYILVVFIMQFSLKMGRKYDDEYGLFKAKGAGQVEGIREIKFFRDYCTSFLL